MSYINRTPLDCRNAKKKRKDSDSYKEYQKYYGDKRWKDLRNMYLQEHPLCEECLRYGRVVPGEHVHHKSFFASDDIEEHRWTKLLDWNNLKTLCKTCHSNIHKKAEKYNMNICYELSDEEYEEGHQLKFMK